MMLAVGDDTVENFWMRIKRKANKGDVVLGLFYRLPSQDDHMDELLYKELRDISRSATLVLMDDFSFPYVN